MFKTLRKITEEEAKNIFRKHTEGYWLDAGGHNTESSEEPEIYGEFIYEFRGRDWGVRKDCLCGHATYEKGPMQY